MRKKVKNEKTPGGGWKKLAPKTSRRPVSRAALRKRLTSLARIFLLVALLGSLGYGIWWIDKLVRSDSGPIDLTGPGIPISTISFHSDGVLSTHWFDNWFGPLRGRSLMEIDIDEMQEALMAEDQVYFARVSREFPDVLRIEIKERHPILVLRLGSKTGGYLDWLVSPDGTIYQGTGYPRSALSLLPSLSVESSLLNRRKKARLERWRDSRRCSLLDLVRRYPAIYRIGKSSPTKPNAAIRALMYLSVPVGSGVSASARQLPSSNETAHYLLLEPNFRKSP